MTDTQTEETQFDWNAFLEKGNYSSKEIYVAKKMAENWVTCAVGTQCKSIPRNEYGEPLDMQLCELGLSFARSISHILDCMTYHSPYEMYRRQSIQTLRKIELRSAFLINQINQNQLSDGNKIQTESKEKEG